MHLRAWLVAAAFLTTACPHDDPLGDDSSADGGSDTGDTGEPVTEVALEDFFPAAEAAHCAWQVRCNGYGGAGRCKSVVHLDTQLSIGTLAGAGSYDDVTLAYMTEAVEVGRIAYDEKAAATCLAYAEQRSCEYEFFHAFTDEELAGQAACAAVFRGRMGKNGPCAEAIECADASICGFDPTCVDMCCVGACRVLPEPLEIGQPCGVNPNVSCAPEATCAFDVDMGINVCTPRVGIGERCDGGVDCVAEALCEWDGNESFFCVARKPAGKACDYDQECADGLVCAYDLNYENGKCFAPAGEGEPCVVSANAITCRRFDNYCDAGSETCTTVPGNGESCQASNGRCKGDFFCATSAGTKCVPVADEGESCDYNGSESVPCSGDNRCEYDGNSKNVCVAPSGTQCPVPADPQGA